MEVSMNLNLNGLSNFKLGSMNTTFDNGFDNLFNKSSEIKLDTKVDVKKNFNDDRKVSKDEKTEIKDVDAPNNDDDVKIKENSNVIEEKNEVTKEDGKIKKVETKEETKLRKKKEECASDEMLSMIMNTLANSKVDIKDYLIVNEDMTVSFNLEKINEFMTDLSLVFSEEQGLDFNEVLTNITDILVGNEDTMINLDGNLNVTNESKELINLGLTFVMEKVNEVLNEERNVIGNEVNSLNENLDSINMTSDTSNTIEELEGLESQKDNLLDEVKDIINELLGKQRNEEVDAENNGDMLEDISLETNKKEIDIKLEQTQVNENVNEILNEEMTNVTEVSNANNANNENQNKDDKSENKDVNRIDINLNEGSNVTNLNNINNVSIDSNVIKFENSINQKMINNTRESMTTQFVETVKVMKQTITGINLNVSEVGAEMELTLDPENLGKIGLKVATDNGIVTAKFEAESQRVKEILESNLSLLKESLSEKGISIENVEVSVSSNQSQGSNLDYEKNANNSKNPHKIPRNSINKIMNIVDKSSRTKIKATTYAVGNNINYIA